MFSIIEIRLAQQPKTEKKIYLKVHELKHIPSCIHLYGFPHTKS